MAYPSSRSSSSRGGSGGGGGGQNMTAYAVAAVLVVLIIVIFMVVGGKKKEPKPASPTTPPAKAPVVETTTPKSTEKPYPLVAEAVLQKGRDLVKTFTEDAAKAKRLYSESIKAKAAGDNVAWQSKFKEARGYADGINREWTAFVDTMPENHDHDREDVAKHYLPHESGEVQKLVSEVLKASKSDEK